MSRAAWTQCNLPRGFKAIPCKWVFKRKLHPDGSIDRYKARLTPKGYRQRFGLDYLEVFAPVVRASTIRFFFSLVASLNLECHAIDISNAFIHADLDQPIYMHQVPGFSDDTGQVLRLNKNMYGLKQAPRTWYQTLSTFLKSLGFSQSPTDGALFVSYLHTNPVFTLVYVDDIQIASSSLSLVQSTKSAILAKFEGRDLEETKFFLQMAVTRHRDRKTLFLSQERHAEKILEDSGLSEAWPLDTPMIQSVYKDVKGAKVEDPAAITQYKSLLGSLMYIANYTRPDLSFAVSYLARFVNDITTDKFARLVDVIKYLRGTASFGLALGGEKANMHAYCDSDWANCTLTRKSITGYVIKCGQGSIAWKSAKQATVSRSTTEAEYIAAGEAAKEIQYFHQISPHLNYKPNQVPVGCDNNAAINLTNDPISAARTKHIDTIYHHVRERVQMQQVLFLAVPTEDNTSDIFTKPLGVVLFKRHRKALGVSDIIV